MAKMGRNEENYRLIIHCDNRYEYNKVMHKTNSLIQEINESKDNPKNNPDTLKCPHCNTVLEEWEIDKKNHPEQDRLSYYCFKCDSEMMFWDDGSMDVVS